MKKIKKIKLFIVGIAGLLLSASPDAFAQEFIHPGILHTQADFERVKEKLAAGDEQIKKAYEKLTTNNHAQLTYAPSPTQYLIRGSSPLGGENYSKAMNDAAAAYQCALRWRIEGDERYAMKAIQILSAWSEICKSVEGDTNQSLGAGIYGYEFANAAELVRDYEGWSEDDFDKFKKWMLRVFYQKNLDFLQRRHGTIDRHYWSNWGLCNVMSMISIGILCDDVYIYNEGIAYYKNYMERDYAEGLDNLVWILYEDERGPFGYFGQMQESNRDQGHSLMAVGLAADICQIGWNQGEDLFAYDNNRIAAGIEYVAAYNSGIDDLPNSPYTRYPNETYSEMGAGGRGNDRPIWALIVNHYENIKGVSVPYSKQLQEKVGIEGGGGHYGGNSGGFDHLGFGTLMRTIDPLDEDKRPVKLEPIIKKAGEVVANRAEYTVNAGETLELTAELPEGEADSGNWLWSNGASDKSQVITFDKSGIYRVTYTSATGGKSTQYFSIVVKGDSSPTELIPYMEGNGQSINGNEITVPAGTKVDMIVYPERYGTYKWSNGSTSNSTSVASIQSSREYTVEFINQNGVVSTITFNIKVSNITPYVKVGDGERIRTNEVIVPLGEKVELCPHIPSDFAGGTWLWNTGETTESIVLENVTESKPYRVSYIDKYGDKSFLIYKISVSTKNELEEGDYYIMDAETKTYLTNDDSNTPWFTVFNEADKESQIFTITFDGPRYKIVSSKDGRYINEKAQFGTNPYYTEWNTMHLYNRVGTKQYVLQNGGSAGTAFWDIHGIFPVGIATSNMEGFPFRIKRTDDTSDDYEDDDIFYIEEEDNHQSILRTSVITQDLFVYPNPMVNQLNVEVSDKTKNYTFKILSADGRIVQHWKCQAGLNIFSVAELAEGIYVGILESEGECKTMKLIKK